MGVCLSMRLNWRHTSADLPKLKTTMAMAVEEVMAAKRSRVLLGEADAASPRSYGQLLSKSGYDLVSARDGTEAWKILRAGNAPSLVVLSWNLPWYAGNRFPIPVLANLKQQR